MGEICKMNTESVEFTIYNYEDGNYGVITFNLGNNNQIDLHLKKEDYLNLFQEMKYAILGEWVD